MCQRELVEKEEEEE
jgi:hypothetical protein